jgi:hypothetical protein
MRKTLICFAAAALPLASTAWAGQPAPAATAPVQTAPVQTASVPVPSPSAGQVYPPLPTLAMLPPASSDDDDDDTTPSSKHNARHNNKKKPHRPDCHCSTPSPRLVVSDESRTYLQDIEHQLDVALAR